MIIIVDDPVRFYFGFPEIWEDNASRLDLCWALAASGKQNFLNMSWQREARKILITYWRMDIELGTKGFFSS